MEKLISVREAQNLYNDFKCKMQSYAYLALDLQHTHPITAMKYEKRAGEIAHELYNVWEQYRNIAGYDLNLERIA